MNKGIQNLFVLTAADFDCNIEHYLIGPCMDEEEFEYLVRKIAPEAVKRCPTLATHKDGFIFHVGGEVVAEAICQELEAKWGFKRFVPKGFSFSMSNIVRDELDDRDHILGDSIPLLAEHNIKVNQQYSPSNQHGVDV